MMSVLYKKIDVEPYLFGVLLARAAITDLLVVYNRDSGDAEHIDKKRMSKSACI